MHSGECIMEKFIYLVLMGTEICTEEYGKWFIYTLPSMNVNPQEWIKVNI